MRSFGKYDFAVKDCRGLKARPRNDEKGATPVIASEAKQSIFSCCRHKGFSLTEILMAIGVLAVGMVFIAGVFPVGLYFSTVATERTIAATVADEAFAKIQLYGIEKPVWNGCADYNDVWTNSLAEFDPNEYAWPSDNESIKSKQYFWSALCRQVGVDLVQVTVFVSRKVGAARDIPKPEKIENVKGDRYILDIGYANRNFAGDGYRIIDDENGEIYRVIEKTINNSNNTAYLRLDRQWRDGTPSSGIIWTVLPPAGSGRNPVIAVYQKTIRF
ncbi:MAG: prepilin-type N-terminal cleavage/methylation domain-containing protein [Phycisphaerae bacterium]|nr:prepilin-type N-terminal cleavage/methylation domain-containing protein [Phycisphaerae bacterium]